MQNDIETIALTKTFSDMWGRVRVRAVEDLDLQIHSNEVFGLLGPNGSGKTTTIKMILGLLHPTKGRAMVFGGDAKNAKINKRIGFLPEESYLYKYLNARETLDFYGQLFKLDRKVRKERIEMLLEMVGLTAVASRPVGTFSKGMARRIGLAQALINDPDLLILDEPTTGLDPIGTRQIKDLILELAKRGKTVLLCSHLLADVEDVCDRIAIMYGGRLQSEGQVRELLQETDKCRITTSQLNEETIGAIRGILEGVGAECSVEVPMEKLESFFIKTVEQAQASKRTTDGAVSTRTIGEYLRDSGDQKRREELLSKLLEQKVESEPVETSDVEAASQAVPTAANEKVLDDLTQNVSVETTVVQTKDERSDADAKQTEDIKKDILDELTKNKDAAGQADAGTDEEKGQQDA